MRRLRHGVYHTAVLRASAAERGFGESVGSLVRVFRLLFRGKTMMVWNLCVTDFGVVLRRLRLTETTDFRMVFP